eukprot:4816136-Pyramimonas_sp.AAC.1
MKGDSRTQRETAGGNRRATDSRSVSACTRFPGHKLLGPYKQSVSGPEASHIRTRSAINIC